MGIAGSGGKTRISPLPRCTVGSVDKQSGDLGPQIMAHPLPLSPCPSSPPKLERYGRADRASYECDAGR